MNKIEKLIEAIKGLSLTKEDEKKLAVALEEFLVAVRQDELQRNLTRIKTLSKETLYHKEKANRYKSFWPEPCWYYSHE